MGTVSLVAPAMASARWVRLRRTTAAAAIAPLLVRFTGLLSGLLMQILLARILGVDGLGVFAIGLCLQAAAVVIGRAGLDTVLMQLGGPAWHGGQRDSIRALYVQACRIAIVLSTAVAAAVTLSAGFIADSVFHEPALREVLPWLAASAVPGSLLWINAGVLKVVERPALAYLAESALLPAGMCAAIVLLGSAVGLNAADISMLYLALSTACVLVACTRVWRELPPAGSSPPASMPAWGKLCMPVTAIDAMNFLLAWSPFAILAAASDSAESGLFSVATRLVVQIGTILIVISNIFAPRFAAHSAQGEFADLESLARRVGRNMILISTAPMIILLLAPEMLLSIFGDDFRQAAAITQILVIGQLANALTGPAGYLLVSAGHARELRRILLATTVLTVPFCWLAAIHHGALGVAVIGSAGLIGQNLMSSVLVWKHLHIQHIPFLPRLRNAPPIEHPGATLSKETCP